MPLLAMPVTASIIPAWNAKKLLPELGIEISETGPVKLKNRLLELAEAPGAGLPVWATTPGVVVLLACPR